MKFSNLLLAFIYNGVETLHYRFPWLPRRTIYFFLIGFNFGAWYYLMHRYLS